MCVSEKMKNSLYTSREGHIRIHIFLMVISVFTESMILRSNFFSDNINNDYIWYRSKPVVRFSFLFSINIYLIRI